MTRATIRIASPPIHVDERIGPRGLLEIARELNITEAQLLACDAPRPGRENRLDTDSPLVRPQFEQPSDHRWRPGSDASHAPARDGWRAGCRRQPLPVRFQDLRGESWAVGRPSRPPGGPLARRGNGAWKPWLPPSSSLGTDVAVRSVASTQVPESAEIGFVALENSRSSRTPRKEGNGGKR